MPQDEQTRFYSISREYQKLKDARYHYVQSEIMHHQMRNTNDPFLPSI